MKRTEKINRFRNTEHTKKNKKGGAEEGRERQEMKID